MSKDKCKDELDQIAKEITMTAPQTNENLSEAQAAELESVMAELSNIDELDGLDELETVTELEELELAPVEEEIIEDDALLTDDTLDELELEVDKAEAYAGQESTTIGASASGAIQKEGTVKTKGGAKRVSTPRVPRDMASVPSEHFVLTGDATAMSDDDKNSAKAAVMAATPTQKKVAEKFENVFQSMAAGRAPSKYVMTIFGALDTKKELTSAEIIGAFKASGVGEGTARSQSGQIMVLFPVLGIAKRDGKSLKLNDDSNIAEYLRKHIPA